MRVPPRVKTAGWIAGLLGLDVWTITMFIWSKWNNESTKVVGMLELHPPFYFLLACLVVSFSVVLPIVACWETIRRWNPKNRFYDLAEDARILTANVVSCLEYTKKSGEPFVNSETWEKILNITYRLERLRINHPPETDLRGWYLWLPSLASWAETKDLEGARRYKPEPDEDRLSELPYE